MLGVEVSWVIYVQYSVILSRSDIQVFNKSDETHFTYDQNDPDACISDDLIPDTALYWSCS